MTNKKWVFFLVVVIFLSGVGWMTASLWFGGFIPSQTAGIIIKDRSFGMRALGMGHFWGDLILEPLREQSDDFRRLDDRNALWVAELLADNPSEGAAAVAHELYKRDEGLARLVGAIGLAARGELPEEAFAGDGILHRIFVSDEYRYHIDATGKRTFGDTTPLTLALIAAQRARSPAAVADIVKLIEKRPAPYSVHAYAADALGAIGDPRAVAVLEEALRDPGFHALSSAFRALVALHSAQAIPLVIARISPEIEPLRQGFVVHDLEAVTGENFGYDGERWREWWASQRSAH